MAIEQVADAKKHASKLPRVADLYEGELVEKAFAVLDAAHADGRPDHCLRASYPARRGD